MKISELTPEVVTPIIRQIVKEFGEDYIYKEAELHDENADRLCRYRENGKPSCIIGHVLDRAGVEYDPRWEMTTIEAILRDGQAPQELRNALRGAQFKQDVGYSWGLALKEYENILAEYQ